METIKNAGNYVSDKIQGTGATASKEANKNVAKDSHVAAGDRLHAAGSAVSDKIDETKHDASAEANKQKATH
ncbi:glucose-repressible protein grg-1 [Schizothecium vesticola]|uniref:Glucose-repressible protein grg-1 n=1 Tax=Schizothecium vesticola TaxID=314040 RepID=A0AA40F740_9PEZI|nr:glucose-repressible protein grg-1 [Schizothecium vesticola]